MTSELGGASAGGSTGAFGWLGQRPNRTAAADRMILGAAAALFVVVFAIGLRALPDGAVEVTPWPFAVLALVAVPLANLANALEYVVAGRIEGRRVGLGDALEVSVLSSAANLLPMPGAALVRVRALRTGGSTYRRALSVTLLVGGAWLATSLVLAGVALVDGRGSTVSTALAATVLVTGVVGVVVALLWVRLLAPAGQGAWTGAALIGSEAFAVAVAALRLLLVLGGLGLGASVEQAVSLTVAGVVASAVGFIPGGLGLREALAGLIAGVVDLPAATGVLATAVDRLVGLPVLAALAVGFSVRARAHGRSAGRGPAGQGRSDRGR